MYVHVCMQQGIEILQTGDYIIYWTLATQGKV
jgi:hypothetical protein